jgi:hypothetical protein
MDLAALAFLPLLAPVRAEPFAQEAKSPAWTFEDVAPECGLEFRHRFGRDSFECILDDTGSGVAFLDYDRDGLLDVYMINGGWLEGVHPSPGEGHRGATNRLYRNLGGMKFADVTAQTKVGHAGYGMGAAVGDYDGDGDEDLYVLNYGPNVLYRNDGAEGFTDVTSEAGLAGPPMLSGCVKWSVNGVFFDADADADLDLFVANYLAFDPETPGSSEPGEPYPGPETYRAQRSVFYRNEGGKFADVTGAVGLMAEEVKSMGASVADFNDDGLPDLFEAGDTVPNALFRRAEGGRWHEVGISSGAALDRSGNAMSSMHGTIGDYDGDGKLDLFVPNLAHGCLYRNIGNFQFKESSGTCGVAPPLKDLAGWGSQFADFDLDGDLDLLVVTGGTFDIHDAQPLKMLRNEGSGSFADVSSELGPEFGPMVGRGAAFGDLDGDGDVDFVVNRKDRGGLASVFRNDVPPGRHWLIVHPVGKVSNGEAIGARVTLQIGSRKQVREIHRSNSYLSQNDHRAHFGLGDAQKVDSLVVRWPSGKEQTVAVDAVDRVLTVVEPSE